MPVYKDKRSGQFYIQFDYKRQTYKRYLPVETSKTDAKKLETKWKSDLLFESFGVKKKKDVIFETFLAETFLPFAKDHYSIDGYKNVLVICKASFAYLKGKQLRQITPADIEKFKNARQKLPTKHDKPRKASTIHRELNNLSKVFSYAVKLDYLEVNPCSKVERPTVGQVDDKIIPVDKINLFLQNIFSAWVREVATLILNTGLRQNDALGLKKSSADFDNKLIRLIQGKSKREVVIPMNDTVHKILLSRKDNGSELFFPNRTGGQVGSIKKSLIAAGQRSKLGNIGARILRRTIGTNLEEKKFATTTSAKFLGHGDLRSINRYQRSEDILREAAESIEIELPTQSLRKAKKKGR